MARESQWARWGLKGKLTISILVVGGLPLAIGMVLAFFEGTRELRELSGTSFAGIASETARKLDLVFNQEINRTTLITADPLVIEALEKRHKHIKDLNNDQVRALLEEAEKRWEARDPALLQAVTEGKLADRLKRYFADQHDDTGQSALEAMRAPTRALFLTDSKGELVASISQEVPYTNAGEAWWQRAFDKARGQLYLENVYFNERLGIYAFSLSVPVMDKIRYRTVGVLHRVFDAKDYLDPSISPIRFGKTGHVMLIDSEGTVMSCPILPTGARLADQELIRLVTRPQGGWVKAPSDGHGSETTSIIGFSPLSVTSGITQKSTGKTWYTFVWQSSDELFAPTRNLIKWISVLGLLAVGLLGTMGYIAASRIVTPIRHLREGAMLIGRGELREPIKVRTGDEIEQLADEFNRMNAQLQKAFSGLEHQVEEQTQEVRFLQEYNEKILDSVPTPILILDQEQVKYVNRAARQDFDLPHGDMKGANLFDLVQTDRSSTEGLRSELWTYVQTWENISDSGSRAQAILEGIKDPLSPQQASETEHARRELKIGRKTYRYDVFHIGDHSGGKSWIGLVLQDTTEESHLQDQLIRAEKMAGLAILTSGLGHELNNPLFGIMGLGEAIRSEKDAVRMREYAKDIVEYAKRMAGIIQDFATSTYSGDHDLRTDVDLNELLEYALKAVGLMDVVAGLEVQKHYQPLPKIRARSEEIIQVFANIIKNAIQAMKGKGIIDLATEVSNGAIIVKIGDSGPGIPTAFVSKIFDPFFTTKGPGQGAGLGLTIVHRIVTKYGGWIRVETEEGRGTTFIVNIPV